MVSDKEFYKGLVMDSDDETEIEKPLDRDSDEDNLEENGGNIFFSDLGNEEVISSDEESGSEQWWHWNHWLYLLLCSSKNKKEDSEWRCSYAKIFYWYKQKCRNNDWLFQVISDDILAIIIKYTNQRANEFINMYNEHHETHMESWIDVDTTEMYAFFGILILTGCFREAWENSHNL